MTKLSMEDYYRAQATARKYRNHKTKEEIKQMIREEYLNGVRGTRDEPLDAEKKHHHPKED